MVNKKQICLPHALFQHWHVLLFCQCAKELVCKHVQTLIRSTQELIVGSVLDEVGQKVGLTGRP
jgi:hypothetical protein